MYRGARLSARWRRSFSVARPLTRSVEQIERRRTHIFPVIRGALNRETSEIKSEIGKMATSIPRNLRKIDGPAQMREILLLAA